MLLNLLNQMNKKNMNREELKQSADKIILIKLRDFYSETFVNYNDIFYRTLPEYNTWMNIFLDGCIFSFELLKSNAIKKVAE